jgi:NH3-dependent NAD+ synthetase
MACWSLELETKSNFGVGFYTKYGDGGVDLSQLPI